MEVKTTELAGVQSGNCVIKPHVRIENPDGYEAVVAMIRKAIREEGLEIEAEYEAKLSELAAKDFYGHLDGRDFFPSLVQATCMGPCTVFEFVGPAGRDKMRRKVGSTYYYDWNGSELRPQAGGHRDGPVWLNALHVTDTEEADKHEKPLLRVSKIAIEPS